jgi:type I restriction enzyme S subunit
MSAIEGWRECKISDLLASSTPGDWGTEGSSDNGVPVLRSTNFRNDGSIDFSGLVFRNIDASRLEKRRVKQGTILVEKSGGSPAQPAGRVVFCDRDFLGTASNFIEVIEVKKQHSPKYVSFLLYYLYQTGLVLKYQQQTTGIINFKLGQYIEEPISLPVEQPEQIKIAEVLSTVDRAIEQTEALIAKQQRIKTGLMQDLLTKGIDEHGNLRTEATHEFKDSPLGRIPVEWEASGLGKVAEFLSGYAFKNHELSEHGWRVVRISNLHKPDFPYWHYDGKEKPNWIVRDGDILFSWAGVASSIDCIRYKGPDALMNQHIYNFKFPSIHLKDYTYYFLQSHLPKLRSEIEGGAGQLHLTKAKIQSIPIPKPNDDELKRIVSLFEEVQLSIENYEKQLRKSRALKTAIMQDLLTGKKRVTSLLETATTD